MKAEGRRMKGNTMNQQTMIQLARPLVVRCAWCEARRPRLARWAIGAWRWAMGVDVTHGVCERHKAEEIAKARAKYGKGLLK